MIESPNDLADKERQLLFSDAANTGKLALEDSPESLDVVGVNFAAHHLAAIMVDILMPPAVPRQHAIHLEPVRVYESMRHYAPVEKKKDEADVEFFRLDDDECRSRKAVKKTDDWQFVGAMSFLPLDPPDVETLVLALTADIRLVELNRSHERRHGIGRHAYAEMVEHA